MKPIETTLPMAIRHLEENGGLIWNKNNPDCKIEKITEKSFILESGREYTLIPADFKALWIWQEPGRSAFQEWHDKKGTTYILGTQRPVEYVEQQKIERKEGWNGSNDYIKNHIIEWLHAYGAGQELINKIEKLREP